MISLEMEKITHGDLSKAHTERVERLMEKIPRIILSFLMWLETRSHAKVPCAIIKVEFIFFTTLGKFAEEHPEEFPTLMKKIHYWVCPDDTLAINDNDINGIRTCSIGTDSTMATLNGIELYCSGNRKISFGPWCPLSSSEEHQKNNLFVHWLLDENYCDRLELDLVNTMAAFGLNLTEKASPSFMHFNRLADRLVSQHNGLENVRTRLLGKFKEVLELSPNVVIVLYGSICKEYIDAWPEFKTFSTGRVSIQGLDP